MPRTRKFGIDFFSFDVDFFEDEKIVCIAGEFGIKGELAAIKLLCAIYRNGYFIEWNESVKFKILRQMPGVSSELLDQIVNRLARWEFFCRSLFDSDKVLTSVGIQNRYFYATKDRLEKEDYPYLLIEKPRFRVSQRKKGVSQRKTPVFRGEVHKLKYSKDNKQVYYQLERENNAREDLFNEFFSEANKQALEQFCMANHVTIEELKSFGAEVLNDWQLTGLPPHPNLSEAKKHFTNTLRKKIYFAKYQKNENNGKSKFQRRRGVEPDPEGKEGFSGSL